MAREKLARRARELRAIENPGLEKLQAKDCPHGSKEKGIKIT